MKKLIAISLVFLSISITQGQVEADKPIHLTGTGADAKISGIKDVSSAQDAVSAEVVQRNNLLFVSSTNVGNAFALNLAPAVGALTGGQVVHFRASASNTGPVTINVNGLGAKSLRKHYDANLTANDIRAGQYVSAIYDAENDFFQMLSHTGNPGGANLSVNCDTLFISGGNYVVIPGLGLQFFSDQADAGPDQVDLSGTSTTLSANNPDFGTGQWSVVSGVGASFGDVNDPFSSFSGIAGNSYGLRWSISGSCGNSFDDVLVSFRGQGWYSMGTPSFLLDGRLNPKAVWTGTEMIAWGGYDLNISAPVATGGRYNPATNTWSQITSSGAPSARSGHLMVWTGSEMLVWGGTSASSTYLSDGYRYNPATNTWTAMNSSGAPSGRTDADGVWTGTEFIVWGGNAGHGNFFSNGARYNPTTDTWTSMSTSNAPSGRYLNTMGIWTGTEFIVWGGATTVPSWATFLNTGARYNPVTDIWTTMSTSGAPLGRDRAMGQWTGSKLIVWGGRGASPNNSFNNGGVYDPATNSWSSMTTSGAPTARYFSATAWTGSEFIVWGGDAYPNGVTGDGAKYDPAGNSWSALFSSGAPSAREQMANVWTGAELLIWSGRGTSGQLGDGGLLVP
jgi:N-acetylneuraminic acid mutarotase